MRRALLLGSQTYGLQGVHHDVTLMAQTLEDLSFVVTCHTGAEASRAGILTAWQQLTCEAEAEDAIIIYYSGHGGRALNPTWQPGSGDYRYLQFLVPADMDQSDDNDFRGILDLELSILLHRLTDRCRNVTVILDCCHAARMVRSARGRPKALVEPWATGIKAHLDQLRQTHLQVTGYLNGNPHAVRLTAAAQSQSAYEDPGEGMGGFFTEALAEALGQVGSAPISWETIGRWVREQVLVMEPRQRPEIEGPADRLIFEMGSAKDQNHTFFYDGEDGDTPSIRGGRLHGVVPGNIYTVHELNGECGASTLEVTSVLGGISRVNIDGEEPRDGAPVNPLRVGYPKRSVLLEKGVGGYLRTAIENAPTLEVAEEQTPKPMGRVRTHPSGLQVIDETGRAICRPTHDRAVVLAHLSRMAHALSLRELREQQPVLPEGCFQLEWGYVDPNRQAYLLNQNGALLHVGDRIYIRITNQSSSLLYANLFDIGIGRKVTLLNDGARSGREIGPGESWCYGYREHDGLIGISLGWPHAVPPDGVRLESISAIIAEAPMDLTILEGKHAGLRSSSALSRLEQAITSRCLGGFRSVNNETPIDVRYAIRNIDFEVEPDPRDR